MGGGFPFGSCMFGPILGEAMGKAWGPEAGAVAGISACCGLPVLGLLVVSLLLFDAQQHYRGARVYEGGVAFGSSPISVGARLPWERVQAFRTTNDGVVLRLRGWRGRLTRWFGPRLLCEGEDMHRLIVLLESKGIFAEDA